MRLFKVSFGTTAFSFLAVLMISVDPSGATGLELVEVAYWNSEKGRSFHNLHWSPEGTRLVAFDGNLTVKVWSIKEKKTLQTWPFRAYRYLTVDFLPTGDQILAVMQWDEKTPWKVLSLDIKTGKQTLLRELPAKELVFGLWALKNQFAAWYEDPSDPDTPHVLRLSDLDGKNARTVRMTVRLAARCFSRDLKLVALQAKNGLVQVLDTTTGKALPAATEILFDSETLLITPNNSLLVAMTQLDGGRVFGVDLKTGEELWSKQLKPMAVRVGDISPDGKLLAMLTRNEIHFIDLKTRESSRVEPIPRKLISYLRFSPDGSHFAVGAETGGIWVFKTPKIG